MAKTLVQTREELNKLQSEIEETVIGFEREFGERLLITADELGNVSVGVSLLASDPWSSEL